MKIVMIAVAVMLSGCGWSRKAYLVQIQEIETSYKAGKLTTAEYLNLKQGAENAYQQRIATALAD